MKWIALACTLSLLNALSLAAADASRSTTHAAAVPAPAVCSLPSLKRADLTPKPFFKAVIPPPCYAATVCPDHSFLSCPHVSYSSNCNSSDGCWVDCNEDGFLFCPGRQYDPECVVY